MSVEKKRAEDQRDADLEARAKKLEADLAELEAEGAKSDVRRKVREGGEREMRQIRDRAQREIDRLDEVLDTFRKLKVRDLMRDEMLYRELRDRFGRVLQRRHGRRGAAAAAGELRPRRRGRARCGRPSGTGKGQQKTAGAQAAQGRRGVPVTPATRRWAWCSTACR